MSEPTLEVVQAAASSKVELTVAGHTVALEGPEPTMELAVLAMHLLKESSGYAQRSTVGFAPGPADLQLATPAPDGSYWDDGEGEE